MYKPSEQSASISRLLLAICLLLAEAARGGIGTFLGMSIHFQGK